ncbi:hypothetical protein G6F16_005906 [Rhizopus arrhizus]|nr:hypothetical protein G6F17_001280 [Rhizopus arrhizus]KAG0871425.1 hypothetical protein G6F16_005906 [Rhizopus arrhizus]KAG0884100.1 hypothetical protein G6F15_005398 [Rhizopus arrhizus]KAG0914611.1 hypothetical protein G6F33_004101 [Rhizopus arrhizus]KAG1129547.1 hypothetical protein G6F42_004977 [Rhizopus arrhizus]
MEYPALRIPRSRTTVMTPPSAIHAQRRTRYDPSGYAAPIKPVYKLACKHCHTVVCARSMKAILLADTRIELYSTDTPSQSMYVLEKDYLTRSCHCRIRDVACLKCRITAPSSSEQFMPSIEESLQNWLTRDSSSLTPLMDSCRCCNKINCENLQALVYAIKKLEEDARLAAEIGQSLLHKHEKYVTESNEIKLRLENQLSQAQERVLELEQLLIQSDTVKHDLEQEKNKLTWEWQKTQKILDETQLEAESCNQRSNQLINELNIKTKEVEKLRACKLMARQADIREDNLMSALEDVKQELAASRKSELLLESKYKKLKLKYESICSEQDKQQVINIELKESNKKNEIRKDVNKSTSSLSLSDSKAQSHVPQTQTVDNTNNNSHLFDLIKELVSANNKLKTDLLESRDMLLESRSEVTNLVAKLEQQEQEVDDDDNTTMTEQHPQDIWPKESNSNTTCNSTEQVVHHHYHYHLRNKTKSLPPKEPEVSPCRQLHHQICLLLERLQQTDTRALNRKLRRVFDIFDLSSMSNSIIENILMTEVSDLSKNITLVDEEFSSLIGVIQDMLKEMGQLRININDLQVEYVKKIEENDARLELEIKKKQQEKQKINALSWLSSVFQKSASSQKTCSPPPAIYVHPLCSATILIPSTEDYSSKVIRCTGPSSSYPTRPSCHKRRLPLTLHASQSATTAAQRSTQIKKKRSSFGINSTETASWLGNNVINH